MDQFVCILEKIQVKTAYNMVILDREIILIFDTVIATAVEIIQRNLAPAYQHSIIWHCNLNNLLEEQVL